MSHITGKIWPCVAGGVAAGAAITLVLAHVWTPSFCKKRTDKRPAIKLTYFNIAGVAEKIRNAFILGGIPFEDERIQFSQWAELKPKTPYGQLPVMTVDGKQMTQSDAMLRFAATLAPELYPEGQELRIDELLGLVGDFLKAWSPQIYIAMAPEKYGYPVEFKGSEEHKSKIKEMRDGFLAKDLDRFLGYFEAELKDKRFLCGNTPTIADCALVPELRKFQQGYMDHVPTTSLDGHPVIVAYINRFMEKLSTGK